jgi:hypothetical protein
LIPASNIKILIGEKRKMDIAKIPEQADKRMQWIRRIEQQIVEHTRHRFTGKLIFILNLSQGGITDGSIQTDRKLT